MYYLPVVKDVLFLKPNPCLPFDYNLYMKVVMNGIELEGRRT